MTYYIARHGERSGPYSLIDLQRYLASGEILPGDLAQGEGMPNWVTVSQILGGPAPSYGQAQGVPYPPPPNLHWALLLLLGIVTCGIFVWVWMFVVSSYVNRIDRENKSTLLYAIGLCCMLGMSVFRGIEPLGTAMFGVPVYLGGLVLLIIGHFNIKASLEDHFNRVEPLQLRLSGLMTFFFNLIYFQYHFNRINNWKRTGVLQ